MHGEFCTIVCQKWSYKMDRTEILKGINEILEPDVEITEDTVIADCDDLDSLGLFNVVIYLKAKGIFVKIEELAMCENVESFLMN